MDTKALEFYTENDYYNLPENIRAELIDGQFYDMAAPNRLHQKISSELYMIIKTISNQTEVVAKHITPHLLSNFLTTARRSWNRISVSSVTETS